MSSKLSNRLVDANIFGNIDDTLHAVQRVYDGIFLDKPAIIKQRFSKKYRHPVLDAKLTQLRFKQVSSIKSMSPDGAQYTKHIYVVIANLNKQSSHVVSTSKFSLLLTCSNIFQISQNHHAGLWEFFSLPQCMLVVAWVWICYLCAEIFLNLICTAMYLMLSTIVKILIEWRNWELI